LRWIALRTVHKLHALDVELGELHLSDKLALKPHKQR
jgi:hypothetical protein